MGTPPPVSEIEGAQRINRSPLDAEIAAKLWRVKGTKITTSAGEEIQLRGFVFGNEVSSTTAVPSGHHVGGDYARLAQMGMNSVRFYLNYWSFEDNDVPYKYKEDAFAWLDQNVEWAKAYDVRLIVNLQVPVLEHHTEFWEDDERQLRFVELWRTIAERYRAEPQIAGYGLLNEPSPTKNLKQWQLLADKTVSAIRDVDQQHILFLGRADSIGGDTSEVAGNNFPIVSDPNVVYEFRFYKPFQFTHQNAGTSETVAREGWYPDASVPEVEWHELELIHVADSEKLPAGDSPWTPLETTRFLVEAERISIAKPALRCDQSKGWASFDRLSLLRLPPEKVRIRQDAEAAEQAILQLPKKQRPWLSPKQKQQKDDALAARLEPEVVFDIDLDTQRGWEFFAKDGAGKGEFITQGNGDFTAISISGTAGLASFSAELLRFVPTLGAEYWLKGTARGSSLGGASRCLIQLEMYASEEPVLGRTKEYLEKELLRFIEWGRDKKVPLYLAEFGTIRDSFLPGRGGEKWVEDMLKLLKQHRLHFAYRAFHDHEFGLFTDPRHLPSDAQLNRSLQDVFLRALVSKQSGTPDSAIPEAEEPAPESSAAESSDAEFSDEEIELD
jgi:endoglucanase